MEDAVARTTLEYSVPAPILDERANRLWAASRRRVGSGLRAPAGSARRRRIRGRLRGRASHYPQVVVSLHTHDGARRSQEESCIWPSRAQSPPPQHPVNAFSQVFFYAHLDRNDATTTRRSGCSPGPALNPGLRKAAFAKALSRQRCNRSDDGDDTVLERLVVHRLRSPYAHSGYEVSSASGS